MTWASFEIDAEGRKICFMITVNNVLFIGAAGESGIVESLHEFKKDKKTKTFKLSGGEIWRRRGTTPLFERVALQFIDILKSNLIDLDEENKNEAINTLIDIAFDISKAEEAFIDYVETENEALSTLEKAKGIKPQKNVLVFKNPTLLLKELSEKILMRLIIAYRKLPKVISIITGKTFKPGKNFIDKLADLLPTDHPDRESLAYDNKWLKELYDIRGDIEHEKWNILPFQVITASDETISKIQRCQVVVASQGEKPIDLVAYLNTTLYNMLTFLEEAVALSMNGNIRYPARLVNVPEDDRHRYRHYRFVLDLVPEIKENLPETKKMV